MEKWTRKITPIIYIYIYIYIYKGWVQITLGVTLSNVHVPCSICSQYACQLDVIYYSIYKLIFMHYFKLQKLEFKQLIDDITIDFLSS